LINVDSAVFFRML